MLAPRAQALPGRQGGLGHRRGAAGVPHASRRTAALGSATIGLVGAGLVGAGVLAYAAQASQGGQNPRALVQSGMRKFSANQVEESVADFDAVWEQAPQLRPQLWQRGLSLYYVGRYEDAAAQFRSDVAFNPNDTEEAIWTYLSEARIVGPAAARAQFLQVGRDSRPVMRVAYEAFKNGEGAGKIQASAPADGAGQNFYALLYTGLYYEAEGSLDEPLAKEAILAACATAYARGSGDYMTDLARVHAARRGWR